MSYNEPQAAVSAPREPKSLEVASSKSDSINGLLNESHQILTVIFDKIDGVRPEKEAGIGSDSPPGQLHYLHNALDSGQRMAQALVHRLGELNEIL